MIVKIQCPACKREFEVEVDRRAHQAGKTEVPTHECYLPRIPLIASATTRVQFNQPGIGIQLPPTEE